MHWFETMEDAKELSEGWGRKYNESRSHMALNGAAPAEYARRSGFWSMWFSKAFANPADQRHIANRLVAPDLEKVQSGRVG
jgi:hypothetical protein